MTLSQIAANKNRWALVNKTSYNVRRFTATRAAARNAKRTTERIFDTHGRTFVR